MALLGFACSDDSRDDVEMYGVPWASYAIKGTVIDKVSGEPVEGVEVKIEIPDSILRNSNISYKPAWKAITDSKGEYKLSDALSDFPVSATDIDGEKNGLFKSDTLAIDHNNFEHIEEDPNKTWFNGELVFTVDFKLEKEKADE